MLSSILIARSLTEAGRSAKLQAPPATLTRTLRGRLRRITSGREGKMRNLTGIVLFGLTLAAAQAGLAQELRIGANDTVQTVLAAQKGKRVTVRVRSDQELTGTVRDVSGKLLCIWAPSRERSSSTRSSRWSPSMPCW
jgi:hypothetical protein